MVVNDDDSAAPLCPPVPAISIQKQAENGKEVTKTTDDDSAKIFQCEEPSFELMQVRVTLYRVTGILCRKEERRRKRRKGKQSSRPVDFPKECKTANVVSSVPSCSRSKRSTDSLYGGQSTQPPITAVVSYMKNVFSSGTIMETYIPSAPMDRLSRPEASTAQYSARWPGWKEDSTECDNHSFTITRVMKQQRYEKVKMAKVSTHVHETIELCVFAGKGKELIPLGETSFVITGDEEEEVIHNTPVRIPRPGVSSFDKHFVHSRKKKRRKENSSFLHTPKQRYELDSNAILQLGVRVFPQTTLTKAIEQDSEAKASDESIFNQVLNELLGETYGEETRLSGGLGPKTNSLPELTSTLKMELDDKSTEPETQEPEDIDSVGERQLDSITTILCGVGMCSGLERIQPKQNVAVAQTKNDRNTEPPVVLPESLVSSASESASTRGSTSLRV